MANSKIGILALQGDVSEHVNATKKAANNLGIECEIIEVRTKEQIAGLDAIIIPGGESTVLQKLCERAGIFEDIKKIKNIFGTCAGTIMLAKTIHNKAPEQKTLELMEIEVDRNAYGRQADSFEKNIETVLGSVHGVFIRAPKIRSIKENVRVLAKNENEIIACEQKNNGKYYLVTTFHPELTTTQFHEHFLQNL